MEYKLAFDNGQSFDVTGFSVIGRNPDFAGVDNAALFVVNDLTKTISKTHAAVAINAEGELLIEDLESTNGTFVEGDEDFETQVNNGDPQPLKDGQKVRLGDAYFTVISNK